MKSIVLCNKEREVQHFFHWDLIENAEIVGSHHHPKGNVKGPVEVWFDDKTRMTL